MCVFQDYIIFTCVFSFTKKKIGFTSHIQICRLSGIYFYLLLKVGV